MDKPKTTGYLLTVLIVLTLVLFAACGNSDKTEEGNNTTNDTKAKVYEGTVDLKEVDKNGDGNVYQCSMDPHALADEPGKCPICKMDLAEVSVGHAARMLHHKGIQTK